MADLREILGKGKISRIRLGADDALHSVAQVQHIVKVFRGSPTDDYVPIFVAGTRPKKAEIEQALTNVGILAPYESSEGIFVDGNRRWFIWYISSLDEFYFEKLGRAN